MRGQGPLAAPRALRLMAALFAAPRRAATRPAPATALPARAGASPVRPPGAAREQVAQRADVRSVGANDTMVETEFDEHPRRFLAPAPHLVGVVCAYQLARGVHHHTF